MGYDSELDDEIYESLKVIFDDDSSEADQTHLGVKLGDVYLSLILMPHLGRGEILVNKFNKRTGYYLPQFNKNTGAFKYVVDEESIYFLQEKLLNAIDKLIELNVTDNRILTAYQKDIQTLL